MVAEFYYVEFSRQFRFWKRARSSSYVTDNKDENGRKGGVRKESNYLKTASQTADRPWSVKGGAHNSGRDSTKRVPS